MKPYKTIVSDAQYGQGIYSLFENNSAFGELRKIIMRKKVKGIVVGYPLNEKGETQALCNFIERYLEHMWAIGIGKNVPVTLFNEYNSSM